MKASNFIVAITFQFLICHAVVGQIEPPCDLEIATYPAGNRPIVIAHGDLNGDSYDDIVVGNDSPQTPVSILQSDEQGELELIQTLPVVSPSSIAIGDLNSDGNADIAVGAALLSIVKFMFFSTRKMMNLLGQSRSKSRV